MDPWKMDNLTYIEQYLAKSLMKCCHNYNATGINLTGVVYNYYNNRTVLEQQEEDDQDDDLFFYNVIYKKLVPALFGIIIILGVFGNAMVIFVLVCNKSMRNTVNLSLLNLAISDITFDLICVPFVAYHYAADTWALGDVACKLYHFSLYVFAYVNVYTLVLISCLRYMSVVHNAKTVQIRTKRNVCCLIGLLWGVVLIANIPILLIHHVKELNMDPWEPYYYCAISSVDAGRHVFVTFFILTYIFPLSAICLLYLMVVRHLNMNKLRLERTASKSTSNGSAANVHNRTSHATRIVITVVVVFGVCWLPLHIHLLMTYFGLKSTNKSYQVYRIMCHVIAYANSCMNPFIYGYVSHSFRKSVVNMFRKHKSAANMSHAQENIEFTGRYGTEKRRSTVTMNGSMRVPHHQRPKVDLQARPPCLNTSAEGQVYAL